MSLLFERFVIGLSKSSLSYATAKISILSIEILAQKISLRFIPSDMTQSVGQYLDKHSEMKHIAAITSLAFKRAIAEILSMVTEICLEERKPNVQKLVIRGKASFIGTLLAEYIVGRPILPLRERRDYIYFRLDDRYSFHNDFVVELTSRVKAEAILLYGSYAQNTQDEKSDFDLLVLSKRFLSLILDEILTTFEAFLDDR